MRADTGTGRIRTHPGTVAPRAFATGYYHFCRYLVDNR